MKLPTDLHADQAERWPRAGRHILAQHDAETVIVYQAYRPAIGLFAVEHGYFGGAFSYERMSWIKPNFLWMMYRSGWGTKEGQEIILALRLRRSFFEALLAGAVPSTRDRDLYPSESEWAAAVARSSVRLQWDPDHAPGGGKLERRALQLGLRGEALEAFGRRELLEVIDLTGFVAEQRGHQASGWAGLRTPVEEVYVPADPAVCRRLGLSEPG